MEITIQSSTPRSSGRAPTAARFLRERRAPRGRGVIVGPMRAIGTILSGGGAYVRAIDARTKPPMNQGIAIFADFRRNASAVPIVSGTIQSARVSFTTVAIFSASLRSEEHTSELQS